MFIIGQILEINAITTKNQAPQISELAYALRTLPIELLSMQKILCRSKPITRHTYENTLMLMHRL